MKLNDIIEKIPLQKLIESEFTDINYNLTITKALDKIQNNKYLEVLSKRIFNGVIGSMSSKKVQPTLFLEFVFDIKRQLNSTIRPVINTQLNIIEAAAICSIYTAIHIHHKYDISSPLLIESAKNYKIHKIAVCLEKVYAVHNQIVKNWMIDE
jgi:hypothetical protein